MSKFSRATRLYILGMIALGSLVLPLTLSQLRQADAALLLAVGALGALAQIFKVEGTTERSSYNISWVVYGFAFLQLGAPGLVFVILVSHIVEWVKHRYTWFIQSFNIAQFVIAAVAATVAQAWVRAMAPTPVADTVALLGAIVAFTGVNHFFVGLVVKLARRQSFRESGVFDRLPLAIDFTLFGIGATSAIIWSFNPFAVVLAVVPLYLIYTTLRLPALQRQTQVDAKTGLFNSRYFSQALEGELARADRFDRPLTVVMADLDLLRNINNSYGHLAGDACLIAVADILKTLVRDYDVVARFGGEEFAIMLPETTPEQAFPRIEAIRAAIEAARVNVSTSPVPLRVTMSFGISGRTHFGQTAETLIHTADLSVYQAKLSGRNRICRLETDQEGPSPSGQTPLPAQPRNETQAITQPPEPSPTIETVMPVINPRPQWMLTALIATVVVIAALLSAWLLPRSPQVDWIGLVLFGTLVALAEGLSIEIYARDSSVSTSAAAILAGVVLYGPIGGLVLGVTVGVVAWIKTRATFSRFFFNAANHVLAAQLAYLVFNAVGQTGTGQIDLAQVFGAVLAALMKYLSTTALVAMAIHLTTGQSVLDIWKTRFRWLWPYYVALGGLAFVLVTVYHAAGWVGVLMSLAPLIMLRFSQTQYIDHTKKMVNQLRASHAESQQRAEQVTALNEEMLFALSQAIDLRDPDVVGHSMHVARYAMLIAEELGLPADRVELVRRAGLLHDIGKLGVPEAVLFKPARLTEPEYELVKNHADLGAEIVGNVHSLQSLGPAIRHHHERFEGGGYPANLHGADIPLEARILSVADTVEAMASDRPYRKGADAASIVAEVRGQAGRQFDPGVVDAFVRVVQREGAGVVINSNRTHAAPAPPNLTTTEWRPVPIAMDAVPDSVAAAGQD